MSQTVLFFLTAPFVESFSSEKKKQQQQQRNKITELFLGRESHFKTKTTS